MPRSNRHPRPGPKRDPFRVPARRKGMDERLSGSWLHRQFPVHASRAQRPIHLVEFPCRFQSQELGVADRLPHADQQLGSASQGCVHPAKRSAFRSLPVWHRVEFLIAKFSIVQHAHENHFQNLRGKLMHLPVHSHFLLRIIKEIQRFTSKAGGLRHGKPRFEDSKTRLRCQPD